MKFRKNYQRSKPNPTINALPSLTKSEFESDLEINSVMARYVATGYLPPAKAGAQFSDLSDNLDFDAAQDKILRARALFLDLPTEIRDEFRTADELLKAFHSERGRNKLKDYGLITKPEPKAPVPEPEVEPRKQVVEKPPAS